MENSSMSDGVFDAVDSINTNRSIKHYLQYLKLSKDDLEKCSVIVDLGSGIEQGFARDCKKMGIDAQVISIDPGIIFPEKYDLRNLTTRDYIEKRRAARKSPTTGTISAIAQHLPLKSNSVDEILALYSVPLYMHQKSAMNLIFSEIARVLKVGGEARIFPVHEDVSIENAIKACGNLTANKIQDKDAPESYLLLVTKTN